MEPLNNVHIGPSNFVLYRGFFLLCPLFRLYIMEVLLLISCSTCVCISVTPEWVLVGSGVEYAVHSGGNSGGGHTL